MITLETMSHADFAAYMAWSKPHLADELSKARDLTPEEGRAAAEASFKALLPDGQPEAEDQHLYTLRDPEGQNVGMIWFGVRRDRKAPYAYIWDLHLDPAHRGRGYGEQALRLIERRVGELGLTSIGLNVFGHNHVARRLYEKVGYEVASLSLVKRLAPIDG